MFKPTSGWPSSSSSLILFIRQFLTFSDLTWRNRVSTTHSANVFLQRCVWTHQKFPKFHPLLLPLLLFGKYMFNAGLNIPLWHHRGQQHLPQGYDNNLNHVFGLAFKSTFKSSFRPSLQSRRTKRMSFNRKREFNLFAGGCKKRAKYPALCFLDNERREAAPFEPGRKNKHLKVAVTGPLIRQGIRGHSSLCSKL